MDIEAVTQEKNDLSNFLLFLQDANLNYNIEDWDSMCGVFVTDCIHQRICLNFYSDGSFRCIITD